MLVAHQLELAVTETELGWLAAVGRGQTLVGLSFGHINPQAALAGIFAGKTCEQIQHAEGCWRPTWLARLVDYAAGKVDDLTDIPLEESHYTPFQKAVVGACRRVPYGSTISYGELAAASGFPRAARAVGSVMRTNRYPLVVPCHRVIGSTGKMHGYSAAEGLAMKLRLLRLEKESVAADRPEATSPNSLTQRDRLPKILAQMT